MTLEEFSNSFDTLLNSFARTAQFGDAANKADVSLDEYEKSVFLTRYQEELALSLYNGKNPLGEGFEQTEEIRRYLSNLIKEAELTPIATSDGKPLGIESNSKFFTLPADLWFITYEGVIISNGKCEDSTSIDVYPVRQDEYHKIKKNPFRGANDRRALRLDLSEGNVEIISKYTVTKYYLRYLRKLKPIVLQNFTNEGVSVDGVSTATDCELPSFLHQRILEGAVMLALRSKGININTENK